MNRHLIWILLVGACLASCNRKIGAVFTKKDRLEVINPEFDYMTAKAKFKFENGGKRVAASANFRFQKDSIIWISISSLGFEGARILINTQNVRVLDRLNKQYYEYTFEELSRQYDFEFDFKMIQSVLLGNLIEPHEKQKIQKSEKYYSYDNAKGAYLFTNFIGASTMKLEKVTVVDEGTKNSISVNYSDFILVKDQVFPNRILAIIDYDSESKSNTAINISYNKMEIESSPLKFPYSVSSKYERK